MQPYISSIIGERIVYMGEKSFERQKKPLKKSAGTCSQIHEKKVN